MKIGIFGGTFDPPHIGHINACLKFLSSFEMDKLYVIPTSIPPHKVRKSDVSTEDRAEMTKLAFSDLSDKIEISDVELKREGKSFTSDTIEYFKNRGNDEILLLCGTDMFVTFDTWHEFEYIFDNATIVCVRRENDLNYKSLILEKDREYKSKYNAKTEFLDIDVVEISSTEIRNNIYCQNSNKYLSKAVYDYIIKKGLYKHE